MLAGPSWVPPTMALQSPTISSGVLFGIQIPGTMSTLIQDFKAPDPLYEGFDTLRDVIPIAKKRDMRVYLYYCETPRVTIRHSNVPNAAQIAEVDLFGRKAARPCNNNPGYRGWVFSFFVTFLRVLLNYPEVFQWEKLWLESHRSLHRELAGVVKFVDPNKEIGFGIWQEINTFSPYLRAQFDYDEFRQYADWLKPIVYHVPAGARFARYVQTFQPLLFHKQGEERARFIQEAQAVVLRDFSPEGSLELFYNLLHLDEAPLEQLPDRGFSAEYVRRETARTVAGVKSEVKVYPGIGIGVPGGPGTKEIEPEDVKAAIRAAYEGGADGVLLSRNYSETSLKNLEAAGDVLRELGRA